MEKDVTLVYSIYIYIIHINYIPFGKIWILGIDKPIADPHKVFEYVVALRSRVEGGGAGGRRFGKTVLEDDLSVVAAPEGVPGGPQEVFVVRRVLDGKCPKDPLLQGIGILE